MKVNTTEDQFAHCPICNGKAIYNKEQNYIRCVSNCVNKHYKFGMYGRVKPYEEPNGQKTL